MSVSQISESTVCGERVIMDSQDQRQRSVSATDVDYFVFSAKDYILALPYFNIIQIVDSPTCTVVPNMPPYVRGVIDFMGEPIPLIDTRVRLSLKSRQEDVIDLVNNFLQRKQDHLNWISRLKDAVENGKEITVEKNPHNCAFGKWYDSYKANTLALTSYMYRFDRPHKAIHNLAVQSEKLILDGQRQQAKSLINAAEQNELKTLVTLFDGFEEQMRLSYQEYAVVVNHKGRKLSLAIDTVKYFEKLDEIVYAVPFTGNINDKIILGIGRKKVGDATDEVMLLDLDALLDADIDSNFELV
jgi:chemotaxis signal transduction protein